VAADISNSVPFQDGHQDAPVQENVRPNFPDRFKQAVFPQDEPVEMSGYCQVGNHFLVFLTDGNDYESGDGDLMQLGRKYCIIGTNRFRLHVDDPRKRVRETDYQNQPSPEYPGVVIPRPEPYVQVIPFGSRNQTSPLPINGVVHQSNPYFGSHSGNQSVNQSFVPAPSQTENQDNSN
jgi:hypothetical protein